MSQYTGINNLLGDLRHKELIPSSNLLSGSLPSDIKIVTSWDPLQCFPLWKNQRFHCFRKAWKPPVHVWQLHFIQEKIKAQRTGWAGPEPTACSLISGLKSSLRAKKMFPFGFIRWHKELSWKEGLRKQAVTDGFHLLWNLGNLVPSL